MEKKQTLAMGVQQACVYSHTFFFFHPGSKYIKPEYFRQKLAHLSPVWKPADSVLDVQTDMSECVFFWWAAYQWRYCHDLWFHSRNHRCWMRSGSLCKACTTQCCYIKKAWPKPWHQAGLIASRTCHSGFGHQYLLYRPVFRRSHHVALLLIE